MKYSARIYDLPDDFVSKLAQIKTRHTVVALALIWIVSLAVICVMRFVLPPAWFWPLYIPVGFIIAGRQGALLQIVHDGSHQLISENRKINDFIGQWLAALPVGLTLDGYAKGHMQHHAHTNTSDDLPTDREKYSATDLKDRRLYRLFLFDILGITALRSFLGHNMKHTEKQQSKLPKLAKLSVVHLILLGAIFQFNVIDYVLLWVIPVVSFNMVLLRFRGIAEHGWPNQLQLEITQADQGNKFTRSVARPMWLERFLIGSLACNFHHEHHLYPRVPFYNLKKLHRRIHREVARNHPGVYVKGYVAAFLLGTRKTT